MKKQLLFGHVLTLAVGGLIYIAFRSDTLLMFKYIAAISLDTPIEYLREITLTTKKYLPNWLLFSLPDGLWIFSYVTLTLFIWNNKITKENIFWITIIPCTVILFEIAQLLTFTPGTFDLVDLAFYLIGAALPISLFKKL
ncbi:MAG: hypothetical protein U5L96_09250 [Owenweeksia sp.]|nr:hypothetical protein [Owenweeksia sp.]